MKSSKSLLISGNLHVYKISAYYHIGLPFRILSGVTCRGQITFLRFYRPNISRYFCSKWQKVCSSSIHQMEAYDEEVLFCGVMTFNDLGVTQGQD